MNLQAKLTLWSILLVVVIVITISSVNLITNMNQQFDATLRRAEILKVVAGDAVVRAVNAPTARPLREALRDAELQSELTALLTNEKTILEVAVVDPKTNEILADSTPERRGEQSGPYKDFEELVNDPSWYDKLVLLRSGKRRLFRLERLYGAGDKPYWSPFFFPPSRSSLCGVSASSWIRSQAANTSPKKAPQPSAPWTSLP